MILSLKIDGLSQTTHSKMMRANFECSNQSANCITSKQRKKDKQTTQNICCNRFEVNYTWLNRQLKWTSFIWIVFVWPKFINMKKWLFLSRQWARYTQVNDTSGVLICMIWQCPNISLQIDWWPFSMDILMFCFVYI